MVKDVAKKVRMSGRSVMLDPMPASERKIVYIALKREDGIRFETKAEGEEKRIIINPIRRGPRRERGATQSRT